MTAARKKCVIFVCAGNAFRSPIAAFYFKKIFGAKYDARSAGLLKSHTGKPVEKSLSAHTLATLKRLNIDISGHIPRLLTGSDVKWADYVVSLEIWQKYLILERFPHAKGKTLTLKELAGHLSPDVNIFDDGCHVERVCAQIFTELGKIKRRNAL